MTLNELSGSHSHSRTATHTRTKVRQTQRSPMVRFVLGMTRFGQRVSAVYTTARDEISRSVTTAGWLVLAVAIGGTVLGWIFGWVEWLIAGIIAVVLLLLSVPFLFGARAYDVALELEHERVVAGASVPGRLTVRNKSSRMALPGKLDLPVGDGLLELEVPMLRAEHHTVHEVDIPTPKRGIITVGPATAVRTDPIGLLRREHEWEDRHEVYVHPRIVSMPSTSAGLVRDLEGNPTTRLVDADMSFHAIREYMPGDSRRQVHWKSTAKTGKLMVRQFEESRRSRMAVAVSVAKSDYATEEEYEIAISLAASLGVQALRDGRELDVVAGAEIPRVVRGRLRAIRQLGAFTPRGLLDEFCAVDSLDNTMPLEDVCALQAESNTGLSVAFVICGSQTGLERLRRAALAYDAATAVIGVVCDETAHPRVRPVSGLTIMTVGLREDMPQLLSRGMKS